MRPYLICPTLNLRLNIYSSTLPSKWSSMLLASPLFILTSCAPASVPFALTLLLSGTLPSCTCVYLSLLPPSSLHSSITSVISANAQNHLYVCVTCVAVQDLNLKQGQYLFYCPAAAVLKLLTIFEQGALHFYFALGPRNMLLIL